MKKDYYDKIESQNEEAYVDHDLDGISKLKKDAYKRKENVFAIKDMEEKKKVHHPILKGIGKKGLKRGIIFSEVLGKPKGLM